MLGGLAVLGCGPVEIEDKRRKLLSAWGTDALLVWYAEAEQRALELQRLSAELCAVPSTQSLEAAQSAWWALRAPWKWAEVFAFGPYLEPVRIGPMIDFWPARPDSVNEVLAGTEALTPEFAAALGASAKGLPALEYLLYEPGVDLIAAYQTTPRRCEYLLAIAAELTARLRELRAAWDPAAGGYLNELLRAGRGSSVYDTLRMALADMVVRMAATVELARLDKLGRPNGATTGGIPQPDKVESPFSGRSLEDIRDNLRGLEFLYFGDEANGTVGLDWYLRSRGKFLGRRLRQRFDDSYAALDAVPEPLIEAVAGDPASVDAAIATLGELQAAFQVEIAGALSLSVGFTGNDGD